MEMCYAFPRAGRGSTLVAVIEALTKRNNNADSQLRTRTVLIVTPGGLEHGGGIGRQMGYFLRAYQHTEQRLRYRVVDSRGPWYLGSSPLHVTSAVIFLARAMLALF